MRLNQLVLPRKSRNKKDKRVGRGPGSGHGKTSGRGHKGAGQRKGRTHYIGFEGGNVPYLRKIPKRGFTPPRRKEFQIANLDDVIRKLKGKKEITPKDLKEAGIIRKESAPVKILARAKNKIDWPVVVKAHRFSKKARVLIEEGGGKVEWLPL